MRHATLFLTTALWSICQAQTIPKDPNQQLREDVARWVETMSRIQREETDWARDSEVLANYKEGLVSEIKSLREAISEARIRKDDSASKTKELADQHGKFVQARTELAARLRDMENLMLEKLPLFPQPLTSQPKMAQAVADLKSAAALPDGGGDLSKRLYNIVELLAEAEKFHQQVHLAAELHKDAQGREYKLQMVYFGLAMAYGVNEDGTLAVVGTATPSGWKFSERNELAPRILQLVASANDPKEAAFINLPLVQP